MSKMLVNNTRWMTLIIALCALVVFSLGNAQPAEVVALGETLEEHAQQSFGQLSRFFMGAAYVMGAFFVVISVVSFLGHKNAPTQNKLSTAVATGIAGCVLLYAPTLMGILGQTAFGGESVSGYFGGEIFEGENDGAPPAGGD